MVLSERNMKEAEYRWWLSRFEPSNLPVCWRCQATNWGLLPYYGIILLQSNPDLPLDGLPEPLSFGFVAQARMDMLPLLIFVCQRCGFVWTISARHFPDFAIAQDLRKHHPETPWPWEKPEQDV